MWCRVPRAGGQERCILALLMVEPTDESTESHGPTLTRCRIVLVSPSGPANVGSVCRVMANMGLSKLVVVSPRCDLGDEAAIAYATHGRSVLDEARVVDDLPAALAGCVRSYATSSREGLYRRQSKITPKEAVRDALPLTGAGDIAFVFGREDYGFKTAELLHFDRTVTIPADEGYPVLNLAMAVVVIAYELHQTWRELTAQEALALTLNRDVTSHEHKEVLFRYLFPALETIGFFRNSQRPEHLRFALRHLFGRVDLSRNECDVLIGMARQIQYYIDTRAKTLDNELPASDVRPE